MDRFENLQHELAEIIQHSDIPTDPAHSVSTRAWVLKLFPSASEELQIAALAHDIDRAIPPRTHQEEGESYDDFKKRHAKRSAELVMPILEKQGYTRSSIDAIVHYIELHEVGGDVETDILRDADSISYFQDNIGMYIEKYGMERTKKKVAFMYERCSKRAKDIIATIPFDGVNKDLVQDILT